jgi:HEAT repeat protein
MRWQGWAIGLILILAETACAMPSPAPGVAAVAEAAASPAQQPSGAQPRIRNTQLTTRAVTQLERDFRAAVAAQSEPVWIGYAVPAVNDRTSVCCGNWRDGNYTPGCCRMEHDDGTNINTPDKDEQRELGVVALEPALFVFYRAAQKQVTNIRAFSADCELDAGGRPVIWLTGVRPEESVALLRTFVRDETDWSDRDHRSTAKRAITALALHAGSAADQALEQMAAPSSPEGVRKDVAFWLGSARGAHGYRVLSRMVRDDPSDSVRDKAIFGLHVSDEPQAVDAMIAVAHDDRSTKVRGQALFWLAQKAGKKATAAITAAIENDPETDVKKKAVFALSQLPKDEGVPLLIQVARNNRNPAVRKQAMFWLGQSGDARALAFFEEILK